MISLSGGLISLLSSDTMRLGVCWRLHRKDGFIIRVTDRDKVITFDSEEYSPIGGFNASANQRQGGLKDRSRDLVGVIESDAITIDDLRSGRYEETTVDEYLVSVENDPADLIIHNRYWIKDVTFSDESWQGTATGTPSWLSTEVGAYYTRTCRVKRLGDPFCGVDVAALRVTGTVATVVNVRQKFTSDLTDVDGYFTKGYIKFTTGLNAGIESEVKTYTASGGTVELWLQLPFNIQVGDAFEVDPGCDRLKSTCISKFNNIVNFQGEPFIPGPDKAYETPDATQ